MLFSVASPSLQYLSTLHVCHAFCATSAVEESASMSVLAMATSLSGELSSSLHQMHKLLTHTTQLQLPCVFSMCADLCLRHSSGTRHSPNSLFRGVACLSFSFERLQSKNQKYVCAPSSVKANWQVGQNYGITYSNKNISVCVHNCYFQCIHIRSFSKYMVGFEGSAKKRELSH